MSLNFCKIEVDTLETEVQKSRKHGFIGVRITAVDEQDFNESVEHHNKYEQLIAFRHGIYGLINEQPLRYDSRALTFMSEVADDLRDLKKFDIEKISLRLSRKLSMLWKTSPPQYKYILKNLRYLIVDSCKNVHNIHTETLASEITSKTRKWLYRQ